MIYKINKGKGLINRQIYGYIDRQIEEYTQIDRQIDRQKKKIKDHIETKTNFEFF